MGRSADARVARPFRSSDGRKLRSSTNCRCRSTGYSARRRVPAEASSVGLSYSTPGVHKRLWKCAKGVLDGAAGCYPRVGREAVPFCVVHIVVTIQTPTGAESTVRSREFAQAFAEALEANGELRMAAGVRAALAYKPGSKLLKVASNEAAGVGFAAQIVAGHAETPDTWDRISSAPQDEPSSSERRLSRLS
jgi:hypothetical protein